MELTYEDFYFLESKSVARQIRARLYILGKKLSKPEGNIAKSVKKLGSLMTNDGLELVKRNIKPETNDKIEKAYSYTKAGFGALLATSGLGIKSGATAATLTRRALGKTLVTATKLPYKAKKLKQLVQKIKEKLLGAKQIKIIKNPFRIGG